MNHLKKIIKVIVNIFTCILLLLLGLVIYGKVIITFSDNAYPNYFGYTFFEVASGSMMPALQINDVILVKVTNENLKNGDIIAFNGGDAVITHRILFMDGNVITVKGDNNDVVDKPITKEQVIGKVVKVFPELGIWKKVLTEPKILFGIFITLLLFDFALSYGDKSKNKKDASIEEKKEEVLFKEVPSQINVIEEKKDNNKKIESVQLLELTRKIDIDEINSLLEGTDYKLEKKEINNIKKEISKVEENVKNDKKEEEELLFTENERRALEYTLRLDLNEIQKKIKSKVK